MPYIYVLLTDNYEMVHVREVGYRLVHRGGQTYLYYQRIIKFSEILHRFTQFQLDTIGTLFNDNDISFVRHRIC